MTDWIEGTAGVLQTAQCSDCGTAISLVEQNAGETRCPACFDGYLRRSDAEFLDNYARFGARSRLVVAEACLRQLVMSDVSDRKLLAMSVYEQFVAVATDLIGLYHALVNRRRSPIIKGILGFRLDASAAMGFFQDLLERGPAEFLDAVGLPHPDQVWLQPSDLDKRERKQVAAALAEALSDIERLAAYQEVGERALVSAAAQLRGPVAFADRTSWLPAPLSRGSMSGEVAALAMDGRGRRVEVNVLSTDEETLGAVVDGVDTMTRISRSIIFAFVSLHSPADFHAGFPRP